MLRHRLITGPLLIAILLALVWLDDRLEGRWDPAAPRGVIFFFVAALLVPLAALELSRIIERSGLAVARGSAVVAALAAFLSVALPAGWIAEDRRVALTATILVAVLFAGLIRFSRGRTVEGVAAATGGLLFTAVYAGMLIAFWILIRAEHSAWIVLGALLTVKSCDIGAYFTGVALGRHKLIPWLSPGKTWEGLAGGAATAALVGTLFALLSQRLPDPADQLPWWLGCVGGLLAALVGQLGDLAESLLKRGAALKDSGKILPGMGGVLDVLDSPLLAGPVLYWLLVLAGG